MRIVQRAVGVNFVIAMLAVIAWYGFQIHLGIQETDPAVARANRAPIGAVVLGFVEIGLAALYFRRGEWGGLVRVFAAIVGLIGLLQSIVVPLVAREMYGSEFPRAGDLLAWYAYVSHLIFALVGDGRAVKSAGDPR